MWTNHKIRCPVCGGTVSGKRLLGRHLRYWEKRIATATDQDMREMPPDGIAHMMTIYRQEGAKNQ